MDPYKVMCVVKDKTGKQLDRFPASIHGAAERIQLLATHHEGVHVDYEEDENAPMLACLLGGARRLG